MSWNATADMRVQEISPCHVCHVRRASLMSSEWNKSNFVKKVDFQWGLGPTRTLKYVYKIISNSSLSL